MGRHLTMMGELTASLAHEITQPIATARNNTRAAMRFLDRNPPDLNLILNAVEAMSTVEAGQRELSVRADPDRCCSHVRARFRAGH
jgi:C4-dicarboxylate-specific signal transduction histidine kinase